MQRFGRGSDTPDHVESVRASRSWWDQDASGYLAEHGAFLGEDELVWGPEGWTEDQLGLLGDVTGLRLLEVGCGAAQGSRWAAAQGAQVLGLDISAAMLAGAGRAVPLVQADACRLPLADESFDAAFTAYGAIPFVADSAGLMREVARVLRPGGRFVFSVTHPVRWAFPDDPGPGGLTARTSYFDRAPYVERDERGTLTYVEHHRTLGDRVREAVAAGLDVLDVVEPEWPEWNDRAWGGWSPLRGALLPGTAIFVTQRRPV